LIRNATSEDIPALNCLIDASVRSLQVNDYSASQIEAALREVYGVDSQLVSDQTYFVVEINTLDNARTVVACGGWSKRKTLYGGDNCLGREDSLLDPRTDAAKIRAFFVHPSWVRRGIGTILLDACETAATTAGFTKFEMGATLSGVAFYAAKGYSMNERSHVPLSTGETLPIVRMSKVLDN